MAVRRESLLIAILLFAGVCRASELVPFIAWSNSDALSSLRASEDLDEITASLSQTERDLTVVFITTEFSFDDLAKYGGVYGDDSSSAFSGLKTSLQKAESQYWSGVSPSESMWIVDFSRLLGEKVTFVDPSASTKPNSWHGLVIVDLSVFKDYTDKDAVVKNVMSDLEKGDSSFLAVFTQGSVPNEEDFKPRSERNAEPQVRVTDSDGDTSDCPIANVTENCFLFCMQPPIIFIPENETGKICNLTKVTSGPVVENACEDDAYVTLSYDVYRTPSTGDNICYGFDNISKGLGGNNLTNMIQISFTFNFISSNTSNYYAYYYMTINATVSLDDENNGNSFSVVLERQQPENLYNNFTVPLGLSYACAANNSVYNNYANQDTFGVFQAPSLVLYSIQVQPFEVQDTTFATAYNCIGYFTVATWMGIFTVLLLILFFYLSILCTFSMKTVDRFEDPRGQTILVEKLH